MLKRGAEQASRIIIDNNKGASDRFIINMIQSRLNDRNYRGEIEEVYVYEKGSVRRLFKKSGREFDLPPQHESVESLNTFANVMFIFDYAKIK